MVYIVSYERNESGLLRWNMQTLDTETEAETYAKSIKDEWDQVLIESGPSVWRIKPLAAHLNGERHTP